MRRLAVVLAAALVVLLAPAAGASRPGVTPHSACVSGWEFNNLAWGTPRVEAEVFLDGPGRGDDQRMRIYRTCARPWTEEQVTVRYVNDRVFFVSSTRMVGGGLEVPPKD